MRAGSTLLVAIDEDLELSSLFLACTVCRELIGKDTRRNRRRLERHLKRHANEIRHVLAAMRTNALAGGTR